MNQVKQTLRRSGISIMAHLISLLGSFAAVLILAVINGSIGYLCAMSVTLFGALGVAKALGEPIWLSYEWIIALAVGCGILRGLLRYIVQQPLHCLSSAGHFERQNFRCTSKALSGQAGKQAKGKHHCHAHI